MSGLKSTAGERGERTWSGIAAHGQHLARWLPSAGDEEMQPCGLLNTPAARPFTPNFHCATRLTLPEQQDSFRWMPGAPADRCGPLMAKTGYGRTMRTGRRSPLRSRRARFTRPRRLTVDTPFSLPHTSAERSFPRDLSRRVGVRRWRVMSHSAAFAE